MIYNVLTAIYLAAVFFQAAHVGTLLLPAIMLHAVLELLLVYPWASEGDLNPEWTTLQHERWRSPLQGRPHQHNGMAFISLVDHAFKRKDGLCLNARFRAGMRCASFSADHWAEQIRSLSDAYCAVKKVNSTLPFSPSRQTKRSGFPVFSLRAIYASPRITVLIGTSPTFVSALLTARLSISITRSVTSGDLS